MKYSVEVKNPLEDPYVYYTDEQGRKLKAKIELVKGGFWGRKGKMKLYLDSFTNWDKLKYSINPKRVSDYS